MHPGGCAGSPAAEKGRYFKINRRKGFHENLPRVRTYPDIGIVWLYRPGVPQHGRAGLRKRRRHLYQRMPGGAGRDHGQGQRHLRSEPLRRLGRRKGPVQPGDRLGPRRKHPGQVQGRACGDRSVLLGRCGGLGRLPLPGRLCVHGRRMREDSVPGYRQREGCECKGHRDIARH
ncbi:MAG: hypothetical protein WC483_04695 [Candidatus Paceibacterota bacterium]